MTVSDWDAVLERLTETRRALANVDTQPALEAPADAAECLRDSRGFADEALRFPRRSGPPYPDRAYGCRQCPLRASARLL